MITLDAIATGLCVLLLCLATWRPAALHAQSPFTPVELDRPASEQTRPAPIGTDDEESDDDESDDDESDEAEENAVPGLGADTSGTGLIFDPENVGNGAGAPPRGTGSGLIVDPENPGSGAIVDPQNPGSGAIFDPENPGSGAIFDPENPGSGAIFDPENPGSGAIFDPENPGSGAISDPQNAAPVSRPSPSPSSSYGPPRAIFSGAFRSSAAVDTRRDDEFEDTLELLQEVEMRVRYSINDRWRAVVEGRLSWFLNGGGPTGEPPFVPASDSVQGRLVPELRDFYVAGRAGSWLIRIGNQSIVWGSTDISKPADIINPVDLRRGFGAEREDIRVPVPAIDLIRVWDSVSWEFVLVPFFVPHRVAVYGSDTSPIRQSGITLPLLPDTEPLTLLDPSLEDLAQPLLIQTALPEERPRNASAGSRVTLIRGGVDVSAGYFFGWDRTPRVAFSPAALTLLNAALAGGAAFVDQDPEQIPELQAVLEALADGQQLYSSEYDRLHTLAVDGVTYAGPIGIRVEATLNPQRTTYLSDLRSVRRLSVSSALGLSYERSDGELIATGEVFHTYFRPEEGDGDYLYDLNSLVGIAGGLQLGFAAWEGAADRRLGDFGIQLGGFYLPNGRDLVFAPALEFSATDRLTFTAGATVYASFGDQTSIGDTLENSDAVFVRLARVF